MQNIRYELDKFQIATQCLTQAVFGYFEGAYPVTVINNIHPANLIIRDLERHFVKTGQISPVSLTSDLIDANSAVPYFNRQKKDGVQGRYITKGNFVKHADKNPFEVEYFGSQHVFEYLYAVLSDYMAIKAALLDVGVIKLQQEYEPQQESRSKKIKSNINNAFSFAVSPWYRTLKKAPTPPIDFVAQSFFAFSRSIDNVSNRLFSGNKVHDYADDTEFPFGITDKAIFYNDMVNKGLWYFAYKGFMKVVPPEQQFSPERIAQFAEIKSSLRADMCSTMFNIMRKTMARQKWNGTGYYMTHSNRIPMEHYGLVDMDGFDYPVTRE